MQLTLVVAISVHILAATFWAGSTFACARTSGNGSQQLFVPQLVAAAIAIISGAYLWMALHEGTVGITERLLAVGAAAAIVALLVQGIIVGRGLRGLSKAADDPQARSQLGIGHRSAAILLAVAAVAMAASRYA